jgi:hypothetical protein
MSRKVKKQASSMSFSISRWFRRISTSRPSALTFTLIVIAFTTFLFGGGLLTIIEQPLIAFYNGQTFLFLYPALDGQFVMDTFFSAMLCAKRRACANVQKHEECLQAAAAYMT